VLPVIAYKVLLLVPWFDVQKGLVPLRDSPQGFTIRGSVMLATPGMFETRFVCVYCAVAGIDRPAVASASAARPVMRGRRTKREGNAGFTFASEATEPVATVHRRVGSRSYSGRRRETLVLHRE